MEWLPLVRCGPCLFPLHLHFPFPGAIVDADLLLPVFDVARLGELAQSELTHFSTKRLSRSAPMMFLLPRRGGVRLCKLQTIVWTMPRGLGVKTFKSRLLMFPREIVTIRHLAGLVSPVRQP